MPTEFQLPSISITGGKLAQLRAKTDRDLADLLRNTIERSVAALKRGDYSRADRGYSQAATLLPLAQRLPGHEFRALWVQLADLRTRLDQAACLYAARAS